MSDSIEFKAAPKGSGSAEATASGGGGGETGFDLAFLAELVPEGSGGMPDPMNLLVYVASGMVLLGIAIAARRVLVGAQGRDDYDSED